jgi:hypothetical protein
MASPEPNEKVKMLKRNNMIFILMSIFMNSRRTTLKITLITLSMVFAAAFLFMSCKKKVVDLPKRIRFDVIAQIDSSGTKSASKAKGNLTAEYLSSTKQLTYNITYSGAEVAQVDLHYGTSAALGAGVAILKKQGQKYTSPLKGYIKLDVAAEDALFKDSLYINISTAKFPDGEIRGQLTVKDKK